MEYEGLNEARELIESSSNVVFLTGAGMSAESGVPTFRGKDGLWKKFKAEELATPEAFQSDPKTVWEWYDSRRAKLRTVRPNAGHYSIAKFGLRKDVNIVTQNVDGLHKKAGSKDIHELHGNIWTVKCTRCSKKSENYDVPIKILPKCECGGLLRPGVVWFGESLNQKILSRSSEALSKANLTVVVGTSGLVQPAASLAMIAKSNGSKVIEINLNKTPNYGLIDLFLIGKAAEILPQMLSE